MNERTINCFKCGRRIPVMVFENENRWYRCDKCKYEVLETKLGERKMWNNLLNNKQSNNIT